MDDNYRDYLKGILESLPRHIISGLKTSSDIRRFYNSPVWNVITRMNLELLTIGATDYIDESEYGYMRLLHLPDDDWELVLVIAEGTTLDEIKGAWHDIVDYRKALISLQGTDMHNILEFYNKEHIRGKSYRQIAKDINFESLVCLAHSFLNGNNVEGNVSLMYELLFISLLEEFQIKDATLYLNEGMENLRNNRLPWRQENGPIDWLRVRDALRYYSIWKEKNVIGKTLHVWLPYTLRYNSELQDAYGLIERLEKSG